jgi:hypothetical protein
LNGRARHKSAPRVTWKMAPRSGVSRN